MYFDWTRESIERPTYDSECIPFVSYHPSGHLCPRYPPGDCLHESQPHFPSFSLCSSTLHPPLSHPQDCDAHRSYLDQELVQTQSRGNGFICQPSGRFAPHPPLPSRPSRLRTTMLVTSAPPSFPLPPTLALFCYYAGAIPTLTPPGETSRLSSEPPSRRRRKAGARLPHTTRTSSLLPRLLITPCRLR